jgi:hypothetical protein
VRENIFLPASNCTTPCLCRCAQNILPSGSKCTTTCCRWAQKLIQDESADPAAGLDLKCGMFQCRLHVMQAMLGLSTKDLVAKSKRLDSSCGEQTE